MTNRRKFLKNSVAGLGVASGLASNFASFNAFAADTSDYKALVCVFLTGGVDGHDILIPFDNSSYSDFARIRGSLITPSRRRENLLGLNGGFDGREFALPGEMLPLQELYNQGDMAFVSNVGPLIEPTNRTTFRNGTARLPPRIGSHNDSQSIWMASQPEGARSGWGGRFSDIMQASNANSNASFTSVSAAGRTIYLTGENIQAFEVSSRGGLSVDELRSNSVLGSNVFSRNYEAVLRDTGRPGSGNFFSMDMSNTMRRAIDDNDLLVSVLDGPGDPSTQFPATPLGGQFEIVARMIARRQQLGAGRQIFFISQGGYDTHRSQTEDLPELQLDLATSMRAFFDSMVELGASDNVTSFTASDFGRTLSRSGSGTDHGWGNHHMVMGGAVNGGQIEGDVPPADFNHDADMGRGRLIPTVSVDQYAGALGRWFGLSDSELLDALPGLANFNANALDGLFV